MARRPVAVGLAVAALGVGLVASPAGAQAPEPGPAEPGASAAPSGFGVVPEVVELAPGDPALLVDSSSVPVAPGLRHTSFDLVDDDGFVRGDQLTVTLSDRVSAGLLTPGAVAATSPLSQQVAASGAVAGVNADFFDINHSGAALGPMLEGGDVVKSSPPGDEQAFGVGQDGLARLAEVFVDGTVTLPGGERTLGGVNQHELRPGAVGLYTPAWGTYTRARVVAGAADAVEVPVAAGVVAGPPTAPGTSPIPADGFVLVGREAGATALAGLAPGDAVSVRYAPRTDPEGALDFAVGGGAVIVRDGEPVDLPPDSFNTTLAPRTAVGISADGRSVLLITIDGRQAHSRGVTPPELAELLVVMGADDALNLDGGGSSTMLARAAGDGDGPQITNSPSDGSERPTPNGIGLFSAPGSGRLKGFAVEPVLDLAPIDTGEPVPVLSGLHRRFVAHGHDETFAPVAGLATWSVWPSGAAGVDASGTVLGRRPGLASVVARSRGGGATGRLPVQVLGPVNELIPSSPSVALAGGTSTATLRFSGADVDGNDAPVEPADLRLDYDHDIVTLEDDGAGGRVP